MKMNVSNQEMYSEVYSILNLLGDNYILKLPRDLFKIIEEKKSSTYNPQYSENQNLNEQDIKRESLSMIALFHLNYWCNSVEEKEQLKNLFKSNEERYQAEIREKYNPDNLFKNNKHKINVNTNVLDIVQYKESSIGKFINKIKCIFTKK